MNNQPSHRPDKKDWRQALSAWTHPRVVTMLFFGFSAGVPLLLIFSTLSLWLREAGISRSAVTFFSWAALGYSFKFVWAPLIDTLPLPLLTSVLGRRRAWLLAAQTAVITAICLMAFTDPAAGDAQILRMALAAVLLGFSSATQDIVIDAYRIECAPAELQALLSSTYIAGYRIGMLVAGAGSLYLASWLGTEKGHYLYRAWQWSYLAMAAVMLTGVITTLVIPEPETQLAREPLSARQYLRFLLLFLVCAATFAATFFLTGQPLAHARAALAGSLPGHARLIGFGLETLRLGAAIGAAVLMAWLLILVRAVDRAMVRQTYVAPVMDFFDRYPLKTALLLLLLIGLYRISDIVLGVIANVFYQDLGFSKPVIASIIKTFGLGMTLAGGFLGGALTLRYGIMRILFLGALLSSITNLLFLWLASVGDNITVLTLVIAADNLSAGIATTSFVAFLSSLTSISFTAVQYAIFSSLMTLLPKLIGGYSGTMATAWGYPGFFLATTAMGIPVLALIWLAARHLAIDVE